MNKLKHLLICFVGICVTGVAPVAVDAQDKIAFLVGVSGYSDKGLEDLKYADNDANTTALHLEAMGFETTVLTNEAASQNAINERFAEFLEKASELESDSVVFIMFSGHGQQLKTYEPDASGAKEIEETPFFCPYDAVSIDEGVQLRGKSAKEVSAALNLVSLNDVLAKLDDRSNSLNNLIVVDACRNNPAKGKTPGITGSSAKGIPNGISLLFAARSGQKSWESADPKIQNGVFTHYLLEALRGEAKNRRGVITWSGLTTYISEEVSYEGWKIAGDESRKQNAQAVINSDGVVTLGEPVDDAAIHLRLCELIDQPDRLRALAKRLPDKEMTRWPVFWSFMVPSEDGFVDRSKEAIELFGDEIHNDDFALTLVRDPVMLYGSSLVALGVDQDDVRSALLKVAFPTSRALGDSLLEPIAGFLQHAWKNSKSKLVRDVAFVRLAQLKRVRLIERLMKSDKNAQAELKQLREKFADTQSDINEYLEAAREQKALSKSQALEIQSLANREDQQFQRFEKLNGDDHPLVGRRYPDIKGTGLDGEPIALSDYRGKVVILDVWAYW